MINVLFCGNVFVKRERWRMRKLVARFGKAVKGVLRREEVRDRKSEVSPDSRHSDR